MTHRERPMTDEEFAELLLKPHADTDGVKLDGTADEAHELRAALSGYRQNMLHWAERRSAVQPSLAAKALSQERWAALPQWSLAVVALVTIVGGVVHLTGARADLATPAAITTEVAGTVQAYAPTADEIAADNRLLSSIDAELSYHHSSPVDSLRLHATGSKATLTGVTD